MNRRKRRRREAQQRSYEARMRKDAEDGRTHEGTTGMGADRIMPAFIFFRRRDIEIETGHVLAGQLVVDIPKATKPEPEHQQMVASIVEGLTREARAGQMPDDAIVYGWRNKFRPPNADKYLDDDKVMAAWAETRLTIAVRVSPRDDDDGTIQRFAEADAAVGLMNRRDRRKAEEGEKMTFVILQEQAGRQHWVRVSSPTSTGSITVLFGPPPERFHYADRAAAERDAELLRALEPATYTVVPLAEYERFLKPREAAK